MQENLLVYFVLCVYFCHWYGMERRNQLLDIYLRLLIRYGSIRLGRESKTIGVSSQGDLMVRLLRI